MAVKQVFVNYSKKADKFTYADMTVGGLRFVKEEIASQIKEKLPKKLSSKKVYAVEIERFGRVMRYLVKVTA